jgi:hypothetical protein
MGREYEQKHKGELFAKNVMKSRLKSLDFTVSGERESNRDF